jgi:hypothetical protein
VKFISLSLWYIYRELLCIGYVPILFYQMCAYLFLMSKAPKPWSRDVTEKPRKRGSPQLGRPRPSTAPQRAAAARPLGLGCGRGKVEQVADTRSGAELKARTRCFALNPTAFRRSLHQPPPSPPSFPISQKMIKTNYAQVLPAINATQFEDLLTGDDFAPDKHLVITNPDKSTSSTPNPAYTSWVARDQAILSYLLSSLTRETLLHVYRCMTAAQAWGTLAKLYSSQMRARSVNTRIALATTKKNQLSVSDYYTKMSQFTDDLAASGAPLCDDELIAYLLTGLDEAYNPVLTSIIARVDLITLSELYCQLLSFEQHTSLQDSLMQGGVSSAMTTSRGRGYSTGGRGPGPSSRESGCGRGRNQRDGFSNQHNRGNNSSSSFRPQCQVCSKTGHTAKTC